MPNNSEMYYATIKADLDHFMKLAQQYILIYSHQQYSLLPPNCFPCLWAVVTFTKTSISLYFLPAKIVCLTFDLKEPQYLMSQIFLLTPCFFRQMKAKHQ